jgi:hypothetical protein
MIFPLQLVGAGGGEGRKRYRRVSRWRGDGVPTFFDCTHYGISLLGEFTLRPEWVVLKKFESHWLISLQKYPFKVI